MKFRIGQRIKKCGRVAPGTIGVCIGPCGDVPNWDILVQLETPATNLYGLRFQSGETVIARSIEWEAIIDRPELGSWDVIRALGLDIGEAMPA